MDKLLAQVEPKDLVTYGLIPEFVGRLPIIAALNELNNEQLVRVLVEPKNAVIRQYQALLGLEQISLEFTDDALIAIADIARERGTGARGLRAVIEERLTPIQFDIETLKSDGVVKLIINEKVIRKNSEVDKILKAA